MWIRDSSITAIVLHLHSRSKSLRPAQYVTVVVNHLKSKGSSCDSIGDPNVGDGQGNCNITRTNAAAAIADWINTDPTASGDTDFLVIGDLNAYLMEDPLTAMKECRAEEPAG